MNDNIGDFRNTDSSLRAAIAWRTAAVADGWSIRPTYNGEPAEAAGTLEKEGWKALIVTRGGFVNVTVWGPDGLVVQPTKEYSWEELQRRLRYCAHCNSHDVPTQRFSFAGRCCAGCLPELQRRHEFPGWTS